MFVLLFFAIIQVESNILKQLCQAIKEDTIYKKLVDLIQEGMILRYWLENNLLYVQRC